MDEIVVKKERLHQLEIELEKDYLAFVRVGNNLLEISRDKLYEEDGYNDFKEYLAKKWKWDRSFAYHQMNAAYIHGYLCAESTIVDSECNEWQIRPLTKLATFQSVEAGRRDPARWKMAWERAIELAKAAKSVITNKFVEMAVKEIVIAQHRPEGIIASEWAGDMDLDGVYLADSTSMEFLKTIPENSIDMIFTDPPWDAESLLCYEAAGRLANRALKPGAYLAIYCGKMYLPEILDILGKWLDYAWTMCVYQPDNNHSTSHEGIGIFEAWRPIAIYRKPGEKRGLRFEPDALKCTRQKDWHDWQQGIEPVKKYMGQRTNPGEIVLDPFIGGGTTILAAKETGRRYLGFDRSEEAVKNTLTRLRN